jgi:CelD/BcsL family acetyltransferase involved in cellulose biosynthesis
MYKVRIASEREVSESREAWNHLVLQMRRPSFFCTWEWVVTWSEIFGQEAESVVLFISREGELKGVLPLAVNHRPGAKTWTPVRTLNFCGSADLFPDHLDLVCKAEDAEICLASVIDFLDRNFRAWDQLDINGADEESQILTYLKGHQGHRHLTVRKISSAPYLPLRGSFEEYLKSFGRKPRYNILRSRRILYEQTGAEYRPCAPDRIEKGIEALFDLHRLRAGQKRIVSTFSGQKLLKFHQNLALRLNKNGWLWLRFLENGGEIMAALYAYVFGNRIFYYQMGFNPKWDKFSPGTVIVLEAIQEAFERGYDEFDFLRGDEGYKRHWTVQSRDLYRVRLYNNTLSGALSRRYGQLKEKARRFLKNSRRDNAIENAPV